MRILIACIAVLCFSACSGRQLLPDLSQLKPGVDLQSFSASITVSQRTPQKHLSGKGMIAFKNNGQLRLVLFSPFGTTVLDAKMDGDFLTLAYPANGVAYQGKTSDMATSIGKRNIALLRWAMAFTPPAGSPATGQVASDGSEVVLLQKGIVLEKSLKSGDRVRYRNYAVISGVLMPMEILMDNIEGDKLQLVFEEPEVNYPLDERVFEISLLGLRVLPIAALKAD